MAFNYVLSSELNPDDVFSRFPGSESQNLEKSQNEKHSRPRDFVQSDQKNPKFSKKWKFCVS